PSIRLTTRCRRPTLARSESGRFGENRLSAASPGPSSRFLGAANDDRARMDGGTLHEPHDQFVGEVTRPGERVDRALKDRWAIIAPRTARSSLLVVDRKVTPIKRSSRRPSR